VSLSQLERWRSVGLVPRNVRRSLGRGRGTTSEAPADALPRLIAVARIARRGRFLVPDKVYARVVHGMPVADDVLRATIVRHLNRVVRKMALGFAGDSGWQARQERARRHGGTRRPLRWDELFSADKLDDLRAGSSTWRDAVAVLTQAMSGDTDAVTNEDLARAAAVVAGSATASEIETLVAHVRAQELRGEELVPVMVPLLSLHRLVDLAWQVDGALLKRAIAAVAVVQACHAMLMLQGLFELVRGEAGPTSLDELVPARLQHVPPKLDELRAHPAWRLFAPPPMAGGRLTGVAANTLAAMAMVNEPLMLQLVEDYRDRAVEVMGLLAGG
jgi:hypothetical protein